MNLRYYLILFIIIFQAQSAVAQSKVISLSEATKTVDDVVADEKAAPEPATGMEKTGTAQGRKYMIATAHPLATQAGYDILKRGGSAADAAFAAQLVLGLVEPQSSGLGGGGFALYWDAENKKLTTYDGRETAPSSVDERLFLDEKGSPLPFDEASIGGHAVGVPGLPKLLDALHERHGVLKREDVFQPSIELAKYGFMATDRLVKLVDANKKHFRFFKSVKDYFLPNKGQSIKLNQNIKNDRYLSVLEKFNSSGSSVFYTGDIAQSIIKAVNDAWYHPGGVTAEDFAAYELKIREPVCGTYRAYKVCSMGEPSSGGLTIIQALGLLQRFDLAGMTQNDPKAWHLIAEASRLAFADRNVYIADPDFVKTPGGRLIDPAYMAVRSSLIDPYERIPSVTAGTPIGWSKAAERATDDKNKNTGTTHISVVDRYGNALSMTSSIETAFGAKMMVDGFLLNNQLTDFSFLPEKDGKKVANRVAPGKRPRSSMAPVIIFDADNKPVMVIGSAGGSRIIGYVLQRIISVLDWGMPLEDALAAPHVLSRGQGIEIEEDRALDFNIEILSVIGHDVKRPEMNSGLTALHLQNNLWYGAADPRREGVAMGE